MFVRRVDKRVFQGDVRFFNEKKITSTLLEKICSHFNLLVVTFNKLKYFSLMCFLPRDNIEAFKECRRNELAERWYKWFVKKHDPFDPVVLTICGFSEEDLVKNFLECKAIQWKLSCNSTDLDEKVVVGNKMLYGKSFEEAEMILDLNAGNQLFDKKDEYVGFYMP